MLSIPITAGGSQLFKPIAAEIVVTYGERVLPIMPVTLVQPYPRLRTLVGNNYATKTKKIDQNPQRIKRLRTNPAA